MFRREYLETHLNEKKKTYIIYCTLQHSQIIYQLEMRVEWRVLYCSLFTNLSYLMLGYSLGLPSPIAPEVKSGGLLDDYQFGIFSGIFYLSAAIGGFVAIPLMYCMSRKSVIIIAAIISTVGWIVLGSSRVSYLLICGRVVTGLGSGLSVPIVPIYIGELASKNTRGRHLSISCISLAVGILTVYSLGIGLTYKWLSVVATLICIIQLISLLLIPYTPTYLVSIGLKRNALNTLKRFRGEEYDSVNELQGIIMVITEVKMGFLSRLSLLFKLYHLKALFVVCIVLVCFQSCGVNLFVSYASEFLDNEVFNPEIVELVIPCCQIVARVMTFFLVDKVGRKMLLFISFIGIITALVLSGIYLSLIDQLCPQTLLTLSSNSTIVILCESEYLISWPIFTFILFNLSFSIGLGPVSFILLGELIPQKVKPIVSGIATFSMFTTGFLIVTSYPIITNHVPRSYFLFGLAILNTLLCVLFCILTPESKRKSVVELEELFKENTIFCCKCT